MKIQMQPIGYVSHDKKEIPRNYTVSDVEGDLVLDDIYAAGMQEIEAGQKLHILFHFHRSPQFSDQFMRIKPPIHDREVGVFFTHSPFRPNPIGLSVLEVIGVEGTVIRVKGIDMLDGTPILDIKPVSTPWETREG